MSSGRKLVRVLIILERAREEWRTLKDFTMKLGVRMNFSEL